MRDGSAGSLSVVFAVDDGTPPSRDRQRVPLFATLDGDDRLLVFAVSEHHRVPGPSCVVGDWCFGLERPGIE